MSSLTWSTTSDSSVPFLDEEEEQHCTKYDQISHFSCSTSGNDAADYVAELCSRDDGTIACRAFWRYLDTMPQLEALKTLGWKASVDKLTIRPPPEIVRRRWLCQLLNLRALHLQEVALASCPARRGTCTDVIFADMIEQTELQVAEAIEDFETTLRIRESQRDPNQAVLGYRKKQPPPAI